MNWKLGSYLITLCLVSIVATTIDAHAAVVPKTEKQSFKLDPNKKSFIDFSKFNKNIDFGSVEFKSKAKSKGKEGPDAEIVFGTPEDTGTGHTVSVEMVSLSLVSVNPVSLDPLGQTGRDHIVLSLLAPARPSSKIPPKIISDPTTGKKKLDFNLKKEFKVKPKNKSNIKLEGLSKKKFKALNVGFTSASPITITDPSFCLANAGEGGIKAQICLAPMANPNPIPLPGTLALMAPALAILFTGHIIRRRRLNNGGPRLAA